MSEEATEAVDDSMIPDKGIAEWADFIHVRTLESVLQNLTPLPWSAHPDPDREGLFYVSGPPDTRVVAEGLSKEDADSLVVFVNELPQALEHFEDLAKLWDALADGVPNGYEEVSTYLSTIAKYQFRIMQLSGNPEAAPKVETAGDLSFMHVGHILSFPDAREVNFSPVTSVEQLETFTKVVVGDSSNTILYLPKDTPVGIEYLGEVSRYAPEAAKVVAEERSDGPEPSPAVASA